MDDTHDRLHLRCNTSRNCAGLLRAVSSRGRRTVTLVTATCRRSAVATLPRRSDGSPAARGRSCLLRNTGDHARSAHAKAACSAPAPIPSSRPLRGRDGSQGAQADLTPRPVLRVPPGGASRASTVASPLKPDARVGASRHPRGDKWGAVSVTEFDCRMNHSSMPWTAVMYFGSLICRYSHLSLDVAQRHL